MQIDAGTVKLSGEGSLNSMDMFLFANTKFDISGVSASWAQIRRLTGQANAEVTLGTKSLQIGASVTSDDGGGEYAGKFSRSTTSDGCIVAKYGTQTLKISGTSDVMGYWKIHSGLVEFSNPNNFGNTAQVLDIYGGGLRWAAGNTADMSGKIFVIYGSVTFDLNGNDVTFIHALPISLSNNYSVKKMGSGTLTFSANNNFTGILNMPYAENNKVQIGNGATTGSLACSKIAGEGTVIFNRSNDIICNIDIEPALQKEGSGILTFGGKLGLNMNSVLTINNGTFAVGTNGNIYDQVREIHMNSTGKLKVSNDKFVPIILGTSANTEIIIEGTNTTLVLTNRYPNVNSIDPPNVFFVDVNSKISGNGRLSIVRTNYCGDNYTGEIYTVLKNANTLTGGIVFSNHTLKIDVNGSMRKRIVRRVGRHVEHQQT